MCTLNSFSLFILTELRSRLIYLLFSTVVVLLYVLIYMNELFFSLLSPIEFINNDLSSYLFSKNLLVFFSISFFDSTNININDYISTIKEHTHTFDYFPVFEINIVNNENTYFYIIIYCILIYTIPLLVYQFYLFSLPTLYYYEYLLLRKSIFTWLVHIFLYMYFFISLFIYIILCTNYNTYHEYFNYELDVEFNIVEFIKLYLNLLLLFYIFSILGTLLIVIIKNTRYFLLLQLLLYIINFIFYSSIILFFFNYIYIQFLSYIYYFKKAYAFLK